MQRKIRAVNHSRLRIPAVTFVCLALGTLGLTQSRSTLQDRYGRPVGDVYRTPKGLVIKPTFAPDDKLCAAHISVEGRKIEDAELEPILDELTPKDARGKYVFGTFLNYICLEMNEPGKVTGVHDCGGVSEDYERVNITKWGNTNSYTSADVTYYRRGCNNKRPHHRR